MSRQNLLCLIDYERAFAHGRPTYLVFDEWRGFWPFRYRAFRIECGYNAISGLTEDDVRAWDTLCPGRVIKPLADGDHGEEARR